MKSISEQFPVHTITIAKKQWSPLIFNMATILTKEVKDVHLEHTVQGILLLDWKLFLSYLWRNPWQERDLFVEPQSTNLPNLKIGRLVPELGGLGYIVKYPSSPSSGTNLGILIEKRLIQPLFKEYPISCILFHSQKKLKFSQFLSLHII